MLHLFEELMRDERGATAVEYGLILAMIVIAMLAALGGVANESIGMWANIQEKSADAIQKAQP